MSYIVYKDQLIGEYLEAFQQAELYAMEKLIPERQENECLSDLLDLLLEGQANGRPVRDLLGEDIDAFCRSYFQKPNVLTNFIAFIPTLLYRLAVFALIVMIFDVGWFLEDGENLMTYSSNLISLSACALVGALVGNLITIPIPYLFRKVGKRGKRHVTFSALLQWILAFFVIFGFMELQDYFQLDVPLPIAVLFCVVCILIYKVPIWMARYREHGSLRRTEAERAGSAFGILDATAEVQKDSTSREYLKGVLKRYRRKCRKKDMTPQQYQVLLDKEIALEERWPYIFGVITVAVDVFLGVRECMNNTVMDGVILIMIYLISHALVLGFIFRAQHKLLVLRKKMTKEAKECGLTLVDLAIAQEEGNDNP